MASVVGPAADDGVHPASDVERGVPPLLGLLDQREVVANAVDSYGQDPDAAPVVEPAME